MQWILGRKKNNREGNWRRQNTEMQTCKNAKIQSRNRKFVSWNIEKIQGLKPYIQEILLTDYS